MSKKSDNPRIEAKITQEQFADYHVAMKTYGFGTNANFMRLCVAALIRAHKAGDTLSRPLWFEQGHRPVITGKAA